MKSYDNSKDLGSLTVELTFLDAGPKLVKGYTTSGICVERVKERDVNPSRKVFSYPMCMFSLIMSHCLIMKEKAVPH